MLALRRGPESWAHASHPLIFLRASPGAASPLSFIVLSMLVWEISLKGFLGQDSAVFDDFGDPSGAFEDLGGSLQHSK